MKMDRKDNMFEFDDMTDTLPGMTDQECEAEAQSVREIVRVIYPKGNTEC